MPATDLHLPSLPDLIKLPEPTPTDKVLFLQSAGWLKPEATAADLNDPLVKFAIAQLQKFHALPEDGEFTDVVQRLMTAPRCALPDVMPASACVQQWDRAFATTEGLTVTHENMAFASLSAQEVHRAWTKALELIMAVCGAKLNHIPWSGAASANIWSRAIRIDGSGSTLAWSYLPGCGTGKSGRLEQRYDTGESWAFNYLVGTMVHELLHALGLDHDNDQSSIMYPMMRSNIWTPQPRDIARLVTRYGQPIAPPTPQPVPTPQGPVTHAGIRWNNDTRTDKWFPIAAGSPFTVPGLN